MWRTHFEDDVFDILLNPIVIIEVLSPSTEVYDRGDKFAHYRQLQSLREYILVSQDKVCVEHHVRQTEQWILTDFQKLEQQLPLTSIQCELTLQEIYESVPFPEYHQYLKISTTVLARFPNLAPEYQANSGEP